MTGTTVTTSGAAVAKDEHSWVKAFVERESRRRRRDFVEVCGQRLLAIAFVLGAWQALSSLGIVKRILISNPRLVGKDLASWVTQTSFWVDLRVTLVQMALGLLIGTACGVVAGLAIGMQPRLSKAVQPLTIAVHTVPVVVLAPLFMLWFGFGQLPKVLIVTLSVFFVIFFNTMAGASEVSPAMVFGMRVMGAKRLDVLRHVYLPSVVSWVIVALRSAVAYALVGAVVSEFLASTAGLGYEMEYASQFLNVPRVFSVLIVLAVIGSLFSGIIDVMERRLLRWR